MFICLRNRLILIVAPLHIVIYSYIEIYLDPCNPDSYNWLRSVAIFRVMVQGFFQVQGRRGPCNVLIIILSNMLICLKLSNMSLWFC